MKTFKKVMVVLFIFLICGSFLGCQKKTPAEKAKEKLEDAVGATKDKIKDVLN